jgi:type I restriction enzyme S subunit
MGGDQRIDWKTSTLEELTAESPITYGVVKPGSEGSILFVRGGDISNGQISVGPLRTITKEVSEQYKRTLLSGGELLVSLVGNPGQVAQVPKELAGANIARQVALVRIGENADPVFIRYALTSSHCRLQLTGYTMGSVQQVINLRDLKKIKIPLPPLPEQKTIAHILGSLDDKIELNRKMNATLEKMAQTLFKSWFVDFDPVIDNALAAGNPIPDELADRAEVRRQALADGTANREAAKPFPDSFQETDELSWIPKGWQVRPIEDCIKRFPAGKKYETKTAEETGAVPILDQGKSGFIGFHNDEPGVKASPDDPIIVFANHTCYMRLIMFDFSAIQNVLPFKGEGLNIFWLFEATKGRQQFNEYKGHWPDFVIKKLVVPTLPLVSIFGEIIELNHQKIYANELKNQSLTKLRDTLLPKLISGELRMPEVKQLTNETLT